MDIISLAGLVATGYLAYKVLSLEIGNPVQQIAPTLNQNYYTNDEKTLELYTTMNPSKQLNVRVVQVGQLYDVDVGGGVMYQVDKNGLDTLTEQVGRDKINML